MSWEERVGGAYAHLGGCVWCRNRVAQFESAVAELDQAQRTSFYSGLPSITGPRAMLRARISEMTAREASGPSRLRLSPGLFAGAFGAAALMIVITVCGRLAFRHPGPQNEITSPLSSNLGVLPNRNLTPGAVRPTSLREVCAIAHEEVVKEVSPSQRQQVFQEYGIPAAQTNEYEVDYLITPGLGGDDDLRNLWPEPYNTADWNAHVKDALEERLHELVCTHQLELTVAQKAIATNWIAAYQEYVQPSISNPRTDGESSRTTTVRSVAFTNDVDVDQFSGTADRRELAFQGRTRRRMCSPETACS